MQGLIKGKKPLDILSSSPRKIAALVKGVSKQKLAKRPQPDKWSATEILAHIADVELVQGFRLRLILGSNGTPIQGFDQDAWVASMTYSKQDPAFSLKAFIVARERNVRLLKSLTKSQWNNFGMHSERGKETVLRVTEMMAGHDVNHMSQLRAMLKG
jgi:hypothetical protein